MKRRTSINVCSIVVVLLGRDGLGRDLSEQLRSLLMASRVEWFLEEEIAKVGLKKARSRSRLEEVNSDEVDRIVGICVWILSDGRTVL